MTDWAVREHLTTLLLQSCFHIHTHTAGRGNQVILQVWEVCIYLLTMLPKAKSECQRFCVSVCGCFLSLWEPAWVLDNEREREDVFLEKGSTKKPKWDFVTQSLLWWWCHPLDWPQWSDYYKFMPGCQETWKRSLQNFNQNSSRNHKDGEMGIKRCSTNPQVHLFICSLTQSSNQPITLQQPNAFWHADMVKTTCWSSNQASEWGRKVV